MLEKNLNELNIFALRDFARRTGVSSPTSKKKEQLIKEIKEIISGEKKPETSKTKQGRPPKVFGYNFANVFNTTNDEVLSSKQTLNQEVVEYQNTDVVTVVGWIELMSNNSALLWVEKNLKNKNYFVPNEVLANLKIKTGDKVLVEVNPDNADRVVKKIFSVNDCPIMQFSNKRVDYFDVSHNLPNRKLNFNNSSFDDLNLKIGENIYVYGSNNNENTTKIIELLSSCKIENKIYVNISLAEKNKIYLSKLTREEKFVANITDETEIARRVVSLATERAKRILENGEDCLVVIDDIASIYGIDKEDINLVKNLVSVTKEGNKGSITLIAVMPNVGFNQIEKLADKRLKISQNGFLFF